MALTKAHNRMIEVASISTMDYGVDPTGATDATVAFNAPIPPARGLVCRRCFWVGNHNFNVVRLERGQSSHRR